MRATTDLDCAALSVSVGDVIDSEREDAKTVRSYIGDQQEVKPQANQTASTWLRECVLQLSEQTAAAERLSQRMQASGVGPSTSTARSYSGREGRRAVPEMPPPGSRRDGHHGLRMRLPDLGVVGRNADQLFAVYF